MALQVNADREWIQDIKEGIVNDKWFGPIAYSLANPSLCSHPSSASTKDL
jgi:hypothetical protein